MNNRKVGKAIKQKIIITSVEELFLIKYCCPQYKNEEMDQRKNVGERKEDHRLKGGIVLKVKPESYIYNCYGKTN